MTRNSAVVHDVVHGGRLHYDDVDALSRSGSGDIGQRRPRFEQLARSPPSGIDIAADVGYDHRFRRLRRPPASVGLNTGSAVAEPECRGLAVRILVALR